MKKRPRPNASQQPSTPPTPHTIRRRTLQSKTPHSISSSKKPRSILQQIPTAHNSLKPKTLEWFPLNLAKSELSLHLTFPTGQTFMWKQTGPVQYTGVVQSHLVSLKQLENGDVAYCFHQTTCESTARVDLLDFLNVGISLNDIWKSFSDSDSRFAELAQHLGGARVLRQDPLECLIQFLCSSNNNIGRITGMVNCISSLGDYLDTVEGHQFHHFRLWSGCLWFQRMS